jgi:hypothetical protein
MKAFRYLFTQVYLERFVDTGTLERAVNLLNIYAVSDDSIIPSTDITLFMLGCDTSQR